MKRPPSLALWWTFVLFCLICISPPPASASGVPQYMCLQLTTKEGLAHPNVFQFFQDDLKFVWFCTDNGASVYDGREVTTLRDSAGLLNSPIISMLSLGDGKKLVNSYVNGVLLVGDKSVRKYLEYDTTHLYPLFSAVHEGKLLVMGKQEVGVVRLYEQRGRYLHLMSAFEDDGDEVTFHKFVFHNGLFLLSSNGIYTYRNGQLTRYRPGEIKGSIADAVWMKDGTAVVACGQTVQFIGANTNAKYELGARVQDIFADGRGRLWITTNRPGVYLLENKKLEDVSSQLPFGNAVVNDIMEDFEGGIWFATYGSGAFRIPATGIQEYPLSSKKPALFCSSLFRTREDELLVSSIGQLQIISRAGTRSYPVQSLDADDYIYFVSGLRDKLLIGTGKKLILKDYQRQGAEAVVTRTSLSMCEDSRGRVWIGGNGTLGYLEKGRIKDVPTPERRGKFFSLSVDEHDNIWCGTYRGVSVRSPDGSWGNLPRELLACGPVNDILVSGKAVWFAADKGLFSYSGDRLKIYSEKDGLPAVQCNTLAEDSAGTVWVGTSMGLYFIRPDTPGVKRFIYGLSNETILSLLPTKDGLYAGSTSRLYFLASYLSTKTYAPPIIHMTVETAEARFLNPASVSLSFRNRRLYVSYAGLTYNGAASLEFRYSIAGLSDRWQITRSSKIDLSYVPPGRYRFRLQARRPGGSWSKDSSFDLVIAAPFYATTLFKACMVVLLCGLVSVLVRAILIRSGRKRRRQLELLNQMTVLKQQALTALINPHFIFNAMNAIQHYINDNDTDNANAYLADFAGLVRKTLEDASNTYIALDRELERIALYLKLEAVRCSDRIGYEVIVDPSLDSTGVLIPNMLIQPFVENAIWHGLMPSDRPGEVRVEFSKQGDVVLVRISDTGVGFDETELRVEDVVRKKLGMAITLERLHLLGQETGLPHEVQISSQKGVGTSVLLRLPIRHFPMPV